MAGGESERGAILSLDLEDAQARLGEKPLRLTPKAFAVLCHLAANRDRLVTKAELLSTLWPGTAVSDGALTTAIRELRRALGEGSREAGFIQTVHRRGYRFVGAVVTTGAGSLDADAPAASIVGRDVELERLERWLETADGRTRQVAFIAGEPGIGKTALVDAFLDRAVRRPGTRVARGQCVERYGAGEAYLPWLDALGRLCRQSGGARAVEVLRRVAPMWLVQLPALMDAREREVVQREVSGAPPERMLREMAEALEALAGDSTLVVAIEDLHWADRSSLELLASVARRREPARLLVLCTYRSTEVGLADHPLAGIQQELQLHRQCVELPLGFLSEPAVTEYLTARFPGSPVALGPLIHRRTDGNALFMVNIADYLAGRDLIVESGGRWELRGEMRALEAAVPESLRAMIDRQLHRVSADDRRLLEAASVCGAEFADATLAPALDASVEEVSRRCAALAHRGAFLRPAAEEGWADGTATRRYAFIHALYADVLYEDLSPSSRQRLHRMVAERLETGYGARVGEIAAELATHFERGRDHARAVAYLIQAADNALQRLAYAEAIREFTRALELLEALPDGPQRKKQELMIRMVLAPTLMATVGYAAPEVDAMYARAEELAREVGETREYFSVLIGRSAPALLGGRTDTAKSLAEQALHIARARGAPRYLTQAETAVGVALVWRGEFAAAADHLERSRVAYEAVTQPPPAFRLLHDPGAAGRAYAAWADWMLGFPERAKRKSESAVTRARELAHPFTLAFALAFGAFVHQARREVVVTRALADAAIDVCAEHGFAMYLAVATVFRGWSIAESGALREGLAVMEDALGAFEATGCVVARPYFLALIADATARSGDPDRARAMVVDALASAERTGERVYEVELLRLLGELSRKVPEEAEAHLRDALRVAREQSAQSLELRVATSLARLWQGAGRSTEAYKLLSEVRGRFTEGLDTPDLRDAAALLDDLAQGAHSARS